MSAEASQTARDMLRATVALPPLLHRNSFVKGIVLTSDADTLVAHAPLVREIFHVVAYNLNDSLIPESLKADGLMTGYADDARDAAFRQLQRDRREQVLVPLSHADFFNEQRFAPRTQDVKAIDILYIAPLTNASGLPLLAKALKILRGKDGVLKVRAAFFTNTPLDLNWTQVPSEGRAQLGEVNETLGVTPDYLYLATAPADILPVLRTAKIYAHTATDGGRDQMLLHALACDVPAVTLPSYNTRSYGGGVRDLRSGLTAPGEDPQALAAALGLTLASFRQFSARESVLQSSGRRYSLNTLIDALPYYAQKLPGYERGAHEYNRWIDAAMTACYGTYLHAFLFHDAAPGMYFNGLDQIIAMINSHAPILRAAAAESQAKVIQCA